MWVLIAGFSEQPEEEQDDAIVTQFDEKDRLKAETEFDCVVASGEYHYVYLARVVTAATQSYDIAEFADDDA